MTSSTFGRNPGSRCSFPGTSLSVEFFPELWLDAQVPMCFVSPGLFIGSWIMLLLCTLRQNSYILYLINLNSIECLIVASTCIPCTFWVYWFWFIGSACRHFVWFIAIWFHLFIYLIKCHVCNLFLFYFIHVSFW